MVYGVLKASENADEGGDSEVRLQGMLGNDGKMEHLVTFSAPRTDVENKENVLLHYLAAKSFIQEKQGDHSERHDSGQEFEEAQTSIISISKSANVVSKFTSVVAVDKDSNQPVSGPLSQHVEAWFYKDCCLESADLDLHSASRLKKKGVSSGFRIRKKSPKPPLKKASVKSKGFSFSPFARFKSPFSKGVAGSSGGVMSVISLQNASGSWDLTDQLVSLCGTSRDALLKGCPKEIAVDTDEGKLLWATALALVLLMGKFLDQKDEWEMIGEKGTKWMKKNLPAGVKYENVLEAAATITGVVINI